MKIIIGILIAVGILYFIMKPKKSQPIIIKKNSSAYVDDNLRELNKREKEAYIKLTELCVSEPNKSKLIAFYDKMKDYYDINEGNNLEKIVEYVDENKIHFILYLDWKEGVDTFHWRITSALKDNFNLELSFPKEEDYPDDIIAMDERFTVFKDYDKLLRDSGFQIGFIDVDADAYFMIVHKITDRNEIIECIDGIGYRYFDKK